MAENTKKLYKSKKNKVISGVLGGFGDYFNIDPLIIRLLYVVITLFTGIFLGVMVYIVAALIVPERKK